MVTEIDANSFEELNSPEAPENFENSPLSGLSSAQNKDVFFPKGTSNAELPTLLLDNAETAETDTKEQSAASGDSPSGVGGTETQPSRPADSPLPKPFSPRPTTAPDSQPGIGATDTPPSGPADSPLPKPFGPRPASAPDSEAPATGGSGGDTRPAPRATNSLADAIKPLSGSEAPSTGGSDAQQPAPRPTQPLNSLADAVKPSSNPEAPSPGGGAIGGGGGDTQPTPRATNSLADAVKPLSGSEAPSSGGSDTQQPAPRSTEPLNSLTDALKPSSKPEAPATSSGDTPPLASGGRRGLQSGAGQPSRSDSAPESKTNTASTNKQTIRSFLNAVRRN